MGDSMAADAGQIIAPDGTVTYDFAGHIQAAGLDLPEYTTLVGADNPPVQPDQARIKWLRHADGVMVASIWEHDGGQLDIVVNKGQPPSFGLHYARVDVTAGYDGQVNPPTKLLLRDDGASDYAFAADLANYVLTSALATAAVASADTATSATSADTATSATTADTATQLDASNATEAHNLTVQWNDPVLTFFVDGTEVLDIDCSPFPRSI